MSLHCAWISNSGITISETFLLQSLNNLQSIGPVTALSGTKPSFDLVENVTYDAFTPAQRDMRIDKRIRRKLKENKSTVNKYRNSAHVSLAFEKLNWKEWDYAWIHFGTTAPVVEPFLKAKRIPFFIQVHGYDITLAFSNSEYKSAFVKVANKSAGVICSSHHMKRLCVLAGVRKDALHVVCNALDTTGIPLVSSKKTPNPSFIHLGRLVGKKHPLATLRAFEKVIIHHPDATLTYIGDGELRGELENTISNIGLQKSVKVLGALPVKEAHKIVASHWVFCQHSVTSLIGDQEGFANSPAEAALLGLPVVSTLHNGIPEHVEHGKTGFLVKEFDFEEMGEYMIQLANSKELREAMGNAGKTRITELCDPQSRIRKIKSIIETSISAT